jgi:acetyl esterase/lipase
MRWPNKAYDWQLMARELRTIGSSVDQNVLSSTSDLFAPLHVAAPEPVLRNVAYGNHERHICNIFGYEGPSLQTRPIVIFVHGGGFVRGDKELPETPFYDNIGEWAAKSGLLGITMNYRLAPDFTWPAGGDDVGALLGWLSREGHRYGGNPNMMFVVGHSAGATHVATSLTRLDRYGVDGLVRGAALCSGLYDLELLKEDDDVPASYFGSEDAAYAAMSPSHQLADLDFPVLFTANELEPRRFHKQGYAAAVRSITGNQNGLFRFAMLLGHNHFSSVFNVNLSTGDLLGSHLLALVASSL